MSTFLFYTLAIPKYLLYVSKTKVLNLKIKRMGNEIDNDQIVIYSNPTFHSVNQKEKKLIQKRLINDHDRHAR